MNIGFYILSLSLIVLKVSCQSPDLRGLRQTEPDFTLIAIRDLLVYFHPPDPQKGICFSDTTRIDVNDTLQWRDLHGISGIPLTKSLDSLGVKPDGLLLINKLMLQMREDTYLLRRVRVFKKQQEPICTDYFFSPLYKTIIPDHYVLQFMAVSYGEEVEAVVLLEYNQHQFVLKRYLQSQVTFY